MYSNLEAALIPEFSSLCDLKQFQGSEDNVQTLNPTFLSKLSCELETILQLLPPQLPLDVKETSTFTCPKINLSFPPKLFTAFQISVDGTSRLLVVQSYNLSN